MSKLIKGLFLLAAMFSFTTYAENKLQQPAMPGWFMAAQAGDYNFIQYDRTQLQTKYLDEIFRRSREDRDYFLKSVETLETDFKNFLGNVIFAPGKIKEVDPNNPKNVNSFEGGSLNWMAQQAFGAGNFFTAADFLRMINEYSRQELFMETRINSITSIVGRFPSQTKFRADGSGLLDESVPAYGQIDFAPLTTFYKTKLQNIRTTLASLQHNLIVANGAPYITPVGNGLQLSREAVGPLLTDAQRNSYRKQIRLIRTWSTKESFDALNSYTAFTRKLVLKFIHTYGSEQWYRKIDDESKKAREQDAKMIVEAFFTRSWIRAVYGMPVYAIGLDYQRYPFHLDNIINSTKRMAYFKEEPVMSEDEYILQEQNYRDALKRIKVRSRDQGFSDIIDGDISFINTAENLLTWLGGNRNLAQSISMVLFLLAADLHEERLIQKAGGLELMKARFRARYASNDADRAYYQKVANDYDPQSKDVVVGFNEKSLFGQFLVMRDFLRNKEVEFRKIDMIQATLDADSGESEYTRARQKRADDLFGK